jgi:hypothetical protein
MKKMSLKTIITMILCVCIIGTFAAVSLGGIGNKPLDTPRPPLRACPELECTYAAGMSTMSMDADFFRFNGATADIGPVRIHMQPGGQAQNLKIWANDDGANISVRNGNLQPTVTINGRDGNVTATGRVTTQQVTTDTLRITGGNDIAEPFEITDRRAIKPGMVVSIHTEKLGQLRISDRAYDRTVAGIVSGANGINPGLTMSQTGIVTDGALPVALTGRVYAWADASNGRIKPGDLLTTSDTPGHVMTVKDYEKAQGAVLGKAMTGLQQGNGLVLVLVSLQ